MMRKRLLLLLALGWAPPALAAADASEAVRAATARVAEAGATLDAAGSTPADLGALAEAVSGYEAAVAALSGAVGEAGARTAALEAEFAERRPEIMRLLAALEGISRTPPPQRGIHPDGPLGAAQTAAMMTRLEPALAEEARALAADVQALDAARERRAAEAAALAAAEARLAGARETLAAAAAAAAPTGGGPEITPLTMMARSSESLTALAAALAKADDAPAPPEGKAVEPLLWPAPGAVRLRFDERDAAGVRRPGLVLATAPRAVVRAPSDAVVRYAGPFLEYGYVAVLEPDAETMVVLAGLAQLQVGTGAMVRRGELLGLMGGGSPPGLEESVIPDPESGAGPGETLYIEIRQGRGPVDPAPLFDGDNG
jgi:septal ring factor EnvC (AmiA/AmiB activator)